MRHKLFYRSLVLMALLMGVMVITSMVPEAGNVEKNNGISVKRSVSLRAVPPDLPYGTRVRAVVDYPSASDCIRQGDTGTIYCYDPNDPVLPYLVNWDPLRDPPCGYEQCQVCGICAPHGWWVGFDEIEQVCPATVALQGKSTKNDPQALRQFRDEVLATSPSAQKYVDLYYQHSAEVVQIMLSDAGLRFRTARLLREFMPGIRGLLDEAGGREMVLTAARVRQIEALLEDYAKQASPELRAAIGEIRKQLKHLEGKTLRNAWQYMSTL